MSEKRRSRGTLPAWAGPALFTATLIAILLFFRWLLF